MAPQHAVQNPVSRPPVPSLFHSAVLINLLSIILLSLSSFAAPNQTISLSVTNAPLEKVFKEIQKQSGYTFVYTREVLRDAKPVTVKLSNVRVEEALAECLKEQPVTYSVVDRMVIIKPRKAASVVQVDAAATTGESQSIDVKGRVVNEKGEPVSGVSITIKGTSITTLTNERGEFSINNVDQDAVLLFTHVSMESFELKVRGKTELTINLKPKIRELSDVTVQLNTGYQQLPKERATGSFVQISKEQLDQRIATDIISKLEGITNGLVFNKSPLNGKSELRIRGESTIFGYNTPLVVVDNFPYPFDRINDINPNDVENITILKDAAAASIWGSQAGNGVIVITTKRGKINQRLQVGLTINTTITEKPNLFYSPLVSPSDYVDLESFFFSKGKYDPLLTNLNKLAVSPVVEILDQRRRGLISAEDSTFRIDALRDIDWRNEFLEHIYRNGIAQQYQLNLSGGGDRSSYYFSAGYDKGMSEVIGNKSDRITLNSQNSYRPFKNTEFQFGLGYSENTTRNNGNTNIPNLYPYMRLMDEDGNQLPIPQHRAIWEDTIINHGFMDWKYYPLQEKNYTTNLNKSYTTRLNLSLNYSLLKGLTARVSYQYLRSGQKSKRMMLPASYYIRDKINKFAILSNGNYAGTYYPQGSDLSIGASDFVGHDGRFQLSYDRSWKNSSLSAIAGFQVGENRMESNSSSFFGYNDATGSFIISNPYISYPTYPTGNSTLPTGLSNIVGPDIKRFKSYFFNTAYVYQNKYTVSLSGRFDGSNIFGVKIKDKITPLWSVGGKWNISKEKFYKLGRLLSELSLRSSFGYNGNVSPDMVAVTTIFYQGNSLYTGFPYATIQNNPNPQLRWERIGQFNIGLDWVFKGYRVSGSIEYYKKNGKDLIGATPVDPTTGISSIKGNFSDMKSTGWDIQINTQNINREVRWSTSFILNYAVEKVTRYDLPSGTAAFKNAAYYQNEPLVGYPLRSVFSYRWGGLNPITGDPRIYIADTLNSDYNLSAQSLKITDLVYSGRYNPPFYGSLANTFSWNGISLTCNISYKLGHYFRRGSVSYNQVADDWRKGHNDFNLRWQKPGDEVYTNIPSFIYPIANKTRDEFYTESDVLVEKSDHVRLQFINVSYSLKESVAKRLRARTLTLYFYANNLNVIIWRANKYGIDPEYPYLDYPPSRSYSIGLRLEL